MVGLIYEQTFHIIDENYIVLQPMKEVKCFALVDLQHRPVLGIVSPNFCHYSAQYTIKRN